MEALAGSSSFLLSSIPRARSARRLSAAAKGSDYGCGFGNKFVDNDMKILRERIRELEVVETMEEEEDPVAPAPEVWMGWEKQYYYERYGSDVCETAIALQRLLLRTRPAVAVGLVGLLLVSVSTTGILALLRVADLLKILYLFWVSS